MKAIVEKNFYDKGGLAAFEDVANRYLAAGYKRDKHAVWFEKQLSEAMLGAPAETAAGAMEAIMDPAIWKEGTFTQPLLGIYADKSSLANRDYMKTHFPKLEYAEIPGTGHFLMLEKPEEFNRLLVAFLFKQKF